jgi:sRNA-binding protein
MQINRPSRRSKPSTTIAALAGRFPNVFTTELAKVRPLAVGIFHVLQLWCPDIPPPRLRAALGAYCGHGTYLRTLVEGAGIVSRDAAAHAAGQIATREAEAIKQAAEAKAAVAAGPAPCGPSS